MGIVGILFIIYVICVMVYVVTYPDDFDPGALQKVVVLFLITIAVLNYEPILIFIYNILLYVKVGNL